MNRKLLLITAALIISLAGFYTKAQQRMFPNISKMEGVTSIYIGKPMLQLASSSELLGSLGNVKMSNLVQKIIGMEVITCDNSKYSKKVSKAITETLASMKDLNVAMEVNDESKDASKVTIYIQGEPDSDIINTLLIVVNSASEPTIISIQGSFTPQEIAGALSTSTSDGNASESETD